MTEHLTDTEREALIEAIQGGNEVEHVEAILAAREQALREQIARGAR